MAGKKKITKEDLNKIKKEKKKLSADDIAQIKKDIAEMKIKYQAKTDDQWPVQYKIQVNTPFQSLAKYYLMILDELKKVGGFKTLIKLDQSVAASPTSGFYEDVSRRKAIAKEQIDKSMQIIGGLVQTVTKLIYSLKEFDLILKIFEDLKSNDSNKQFAAEQNLRRVFIDEVDIKKGRGSINNLTTAGGMEFVSLRDSFMTITDLKSIDDLKINDRIKRILKDRFNEYLNWRDAYEKDIKGRRKIQKEYLHAQVESMKMQLDWAKPYYTLMKQLEIGSGVKEAELMVGLDTSVMKAKIRAITGGKTATPIPKLATAFADVDFEFRTKPVQTRTEQGQSYQHLFRIDVVYTPYVMPNDEYEEFIAKEAAVSITPDDMDFLKDIVGESISAIQSDLDKYLGGEDIKDKEAAKEREPLPFEFLFYPFQGLFELFGSLFKPEEKTGDEEPEHPLYQLRNDMKNLNKDVINMTFWSYENFKDENGWMTWTGPLAA